jgi:hypothetical protein
VIATVNVTVDVAAIVVAVSALIVAILAHRK